MKAQSRCDIAFRGILVIVYFIIYIYIYIYNIIYNIYIHIYFIAANRLDIYQRPRSAVYDLGLHCLQLLRLKRRLRSVGAYLLLL